MFRTMRRHRQALSQEECLAVLHRGTNGVLAVSGDEGYPYAVPLSYLFRQGKLYFHWALSGHKLDSIAREPKVSFCVVDQDQVVPEKFTTYFRSVIAFGTARVLQDPQEKRAAFDLLANKYTPGDEAGCRAEVEKQFDHACMVELDIQHMTGKQARELIPTEQK